MSSSVERVGEFVLDRPACNTFILLCTALAFCPGRSVQKPTEEFFHPSINSKMNQRRYKRNFNLIILAKIFKQQAIMLWQTIYSSRAATVRLFLAISGDK